jgi:hypothetical protein
MNSINCHPQAFSHTVWHLAFANKGVGAGGKSRLLPGVQLADENYDGGGRADCPQLGQGIAGVQGD